MRAALPDANAPLPGVLIANKVDLREGGVNSRAVVDAQVNTLRMRETKLTGDGQNSSTAEFDPARPDLALSSYWIWDSCPRLAAVSSNRL